MRGFTEPVRHAVVGLGGAGRGHARATAASHFGILVAVADPDAEARRWAEQRFGVPTFENHQKLLEWGMADSVSLAIPHHPKDAAAFDCIEMGLHVLVEKPLAIRIGTARRLVEAADRRGVWLSVGHQYRTFGAPQTIKRVLDDGSLGAVADVLWTWHQFRPDAYFERQPWLRSPAEAGGGLLALQLAHDLDLLVWLFGSPRSVTAVLRDALHRQATEDAAAAIIEFDSGPCVTLQASINRPPAHVVRHVVGDRGMLVLPAVEGLVSDADEDIRLGLFDPPLTAARRILDGTHAQPAIRWERAKKVPALGSEPRWKRPRRVWRRLGLYRPRPGRAALLDSFFRSVRTGSEPLVSGRSALPSVELRNAMVVSSVEGRTVDMPLDADEVDRVYDQLEQPESINREEP